MGIRVSIFGLWVKRNQVYYKYIDRAISAPQRMPHSQMIFLIMRLRAMVWGWPATTLWYVRVYGREKMQKTKTWCIALSGHQAQPIHKYSMSSLCISWIREKRKRKQQQKRGAACVQVFIRSRGWMQLNSVFRCRYCSAAGSSFLCLCYDNKWCVRCCCLFCQQRRGKMRVTPVGLYLYTIINEYGCESLVENSARIPSDGFIKSMARPNIIVSIQYQMRRLYAPGLLNIGYWLIERILLRYSRFETRWRRIEPHWQKI